MNPGSLRDTYLAAAKIRAQSQLMEVLVHLHEPYRTTITGNEELFAQHVVVGFRFMVDVHPRGRGPITKESYIVMLVGHIVREKPTRALIQENSLQSADEACSWLAYSLLVERRATEEEVHFLVVTARMQEDTRSGWEIASTVDSRLRFFVSEKGRYTRIDS